MPHTEEYRLKVLRGVAGTVMDMMRVHEKGVYT